MRARPEKPPEDVGRAMRRRGTTGRRASGELESEILAALWAADGPQNAGQVHAVVGDGIAYNTVLTILVRLWEKGMLSRERAGRGHLYAPTVDHARLAASQMLAALEGGTDQEAVLHHFVADLSAAEAQALRQVLDPRAANPKRSSGRSSGR